LSDALREIDNTERHPDSLRESTDRNVKIDFAESEIISVINLMYQDISEKSIEINARQNQVVP